MVTVCKIVESLEEAVVVHVLVTADIVHATLVLVCKYPVAVGNVIITTAPLGNTVAV